MLLSFLVDRPSLVGIRVQVDTDNSMNGRKGSIAAIGADEEYDAQGFFKVEFDEFQIVGSESVALADNDRSYWFTSKELRTL